MPDIGLIELILIGLVGFLVLGPERLPEFLGQMGRTVRQGKAWIANLRMQLEQEKAQIIAPVQQVKDEIQDSIKDVGDAVKIDVSLDQKATAKLETKTETKGK